MKKLLALAALASLGGVALQAQAADVGLGVAVQSDDSRIYVPIDFGDAWRLEPSVRYLHSKSSSGGGSFKNESFELGVGAFALLPLHESVRLYYGARLAYIEAETTDTSFGSRNSIKADGYRISPTVGFEYLINKHISIGGEAEWFYADVDSSPDDGFFYGADQKSQGTDTRLVVRVRF
jgi:hypothetical protein